MFSHCGGGLNRRQPNTRPNSRSKTDVGLDPTCPSESLRYLSQNIFTHQKCKNNWGTSVVSAGSKDYDFRGDNQETGYGVGGYSMISWIIGYFVVYPHYCPAQGFQVSLFVSPISLRFEVTLGSGILIPTSSSTDLPKVHLETMFLLHLQAHLSWPHVYGR